MQQVQASDIDSYIASFPPPVQKVLHKLRATIKEAAPDAEETIKYAIPTFVLHGNLVHFAAYKNHIGLYPAPRAIEKFTKELSPYKGGRGTVQFPLDKPIPYELVRQIVEFRVQDNMSKVKPGKRMKTCPRGHRFMKSSDCPSCPICEKENNSNSGFMQTLSAPARRALQSKSISSLKDLSQYKEQEILSLHGIGPASLPILREALKKEGLKFKTSSV